MKTIGFFWLRFRRAYDSAYDSDFWFSLGQKRSYDSDSDSDSVASENQLLGDLQSTQVTREQNFQEWNEHSNFSL